MTINFCTIVGNSAPTSAGGGLYNNGAFARSDAILKNSIVGDNPEGDCAQLQGLSAISGLGANLDTDGTCGTTNFAQVTSAQLNLAPLALNPPGVTETLALLPSSVAIDATGCTDALGNPVVTDQRGASRPDLGEAVCDIGAYEFQDSFAGQPGAPNCQGKSVSALSNQYGTLDAAAAALGFPSAKALQDAIRAFCSG
jgi:hypothetical protein